MADVMDATNQERAKRVAVERIVGFAKQFDEVHLNLACHAAFPLVLTPDLLYQIWAHFVPESPWSGVARVLLSRLCRQVGYEMYEMDIAVRNLLLRELKEQFGQERLDELADFLMDYVAQRLTGDDPDTEDLAEAQEWTALVYTKPTEAAHKLAEAWSKRLKQEDEDITEVLRLASLTETLAEPLIESGFEPLLIYSRGMANFVYGKHESAAALITGLLANKEPRLRIAGINLPIPDPIIKTLSGADKQKSFDILSQLYTAFDLFLPLPAGDPAYVDCQEVRGDWDILEDLGRKIIRSQRPTCQLYTGHRGVGKTTEWLRLLKYLHDYKYFAVYFAADEGDIELQDTEYSDILLACTRHVLETLKDIVKPEPLLNWLKSRWGSLRDLALTDVALDGLSIEDQISQFAKLTANLRRVPNLRQEIRKQVDAHRGSLLDGLNEFIADAQKQLQNRGFSKLVIVVDHLDRIVSTIQENGRTNYDEIFIDHSEQLKSLNCHVIYTVPISMMYSGSATLLEDNYGKSEVVPMIMVRTPDNQEHPPGIDKLKEVIAKRVERVDVEISQNLETKLFDSADTLKQICLMSGGHVRSLLMLVQDCLQKIETLPIPRKAVTRAIIRRREMYRHMVSNEDWRILAQVSRLKRIKNDDLHLNLLFNRCLLEYRYIDSKGEIKLWYDVDPVIRDIQEFQEALKFYI